MDWRVFLSGVLVGWLIEWVIDWVYWRNRQPVTLMPPEGRDWKSTLAELDDLRGQLTACQTDLRERTAEVAALKVRLEKTESDLEEQRRAVKGAAGAAAVAGAAVGAAAAGGGEEAGVVAVPAPFAAGMRTDDLVAIDGIGPSIAVLLIDNDVPTYQKLGDSSVDDLKAILKAGGPQYNAADPTTWPEQAKLAAAGKWAALWALQEELSAASERKHDDLTRIEGIGDQVAALLRENRIHTYAQLRDTDVEQLRAILHKGGPQYNLCDPTTWPEQAALAAKKDWAALAAMQATLIGGREPDDDLQVIEGIGPAISQVFHDANIRTYKVLAVTDEAALKAILKTAGPQFQMADPGTWPEQAALAAEGKWKALEAWQERLKAGRRES